MRHVQLEHVEAGGHQGARGVDVRRGDPGQVLLGRRADHLHRQRARHPAGAQGVHAVRAAVGHRAGVADLAGDLGAGLVDRLGQPGQPGPGLRADHDLLAVGAPLRRDRQVGDRGQPDAAPRHREVVVDQRVGDLPGRRPPLEGRRLDGAVAQRDRAERRGGEHVGGHASQTRTRFSSVEPGAVGNDGLPSALDQISLIAVGYAVLVALLAAYVGLPLAGAAALAGLDGVDARAAARAPGGGRARRCAVRRRAGRRSAPTSATCSPRSA